MEYIYINLEEYGTGKESKILIVFNDMMLICLAIKNLIR